MENQSQHLTETQRNWLIECLQKIEKLSDGTLGNWKTDPLDFELKEDSKPICFRTCPVSKVYTKC